MAAPVSLLVHAGKNRLRYLITGDGTGGTVVYTTTGLANSATTNLVGGSTGKNGPLHNIEQAAVQGYGAIAAGALTQAQARALWLNDRSGDDPGASKPCAQPAITRRAGTGTLDPSVDANVDGSGNPVVNVVIPAQAGEWYLDLEVPGTIGD